MAETMLTGGSLRAGIWQGRVSGGKTEPRLEMRHEDAALPQLSVIRGDDDWIVRVPIPAHLLSEGVQTFLLAETGSDRVLGHFTLIVGVPMEDDIRAELDLLRAELDMLKRAFRRHCLETSRP